MTISPIITSAFHTLWWLLPLLLLVAVLKTSWFKGWIGELLVKWSARLFLKKAEYHRFHNIIVPTPDGATQIDHIFVSQYGIFVVETKNLRGWIFGSENDAMWTLKLYKKTYQFQNPLRQNYKHLKALESLLKLSSNKLYSVVVFVGGSTFKTSIPENVTYGGEYIRYIKSNKRILLTQTEIDSAVQTIGALCKDRSITSTKQHIATLKSRDDPNSPRLCPKCGNPMVLRTAKAGSRRGSRFWGCSQFPKCRITQNVS